MYYLWVAYRNRGKGFYLPALENWASRVRLSTIETGLQEDVYIPVQSRQHQWSITPPAGYQWKDGGNESRELKEEGAYQVYSPETRYEFVIRAARYTRESTVFSKFRRPQGQMMTIGRQEECDVCYPSPLVSGAHAVLQWQGDGSCNYSDRSRNGSYINGKALKGGGSVRLSFGDRVNILPGLQLIFLGDAIAINQPAGLKLSSKLQAFSESMLPAYNGMKDEDILVYREYHRAPRRMQKPNVGSIELESPLNKEKKKELPALLAIGPSMTMILPMMVSSLVTGADLVARLAMVGTSAALSVTWAIANRRYQREESRLSEEDRQAMCRQYYAEMEETLSTEVNRERERLLHNYLSVSECISLPSASNHRLWERMPAHQDFLSVRLGLGEAPLPMEIMVQKPRMALINDPLRDEPQRLKDMYSTIHNVPIVLDLARHQNVGVLGAKDSPWFLQSLVLQLAANHSYQDVHIAILHDEASAPHWEWAKWLPHVYASGGQSLRMVVSRPEAIREVLSHIDEELGIRADLQQESQDNSTEEVIDWNNKLPYYVIVCTDAKLMEDQPIMRYLASSGLGFSMIIQARSMEMLPKECKIVIEAKDSLGAVYSAEGEMTGVQFERTDEMHLQQFSSAIASIRVKDSVENSSIPTLVTFLEVYKARQVEQLDVWRFWNENHAYQGIRSYIGLKAGATPFVLDISDKAHGPHGLIAGTTGAGKSVLLQSYILSLAINYSPTEVQFILIDYKGGGTSEDFRDLPHVAGVIDSLQGERAIFRALASIKGEILRREEIFKSVGVNSIDDYMQLFNNDPTAESLGHLIIIVDEFAELKKEQPEFMHELVSAARVGRSLGMHLILATQKPSNSVSDEIAANTRFRVCLRVASKSDSQEMLHRPEAAYIKGMGRCYVQVGNDEVFEQVQTSYSGAAYRPDALRSDEEPQLLNEMGQPIKFKKKKSNEEKQGRELNELYAVLNYISKVREEHNAPAARKLWLDELDRTLMLQDIPTMKGNSFENGRWAQNSDEELLAYYAMGDDVAMQRHLPIAMDFINDKNYMLVGLSGMGKTTAIQSIAVSLALRYTPKQVSMYFFSLTSKSLSSLAALPHVGDIVYEDSLDEQIRLIDMINAESERRRKLFAQVMTDNYIQYNRAAAQSGGKFETVPAMVVFIDRMQQLRAWGDMRKDDKLAMFYNLLCSGASQGIYFVMTAFARNELPGKYQSFVTGVALNLNDRADYIEALNVRIPLDWGGIAAYQGRGAVAQVDKNDNAVSVFEIQVGLYGTSSSDTERSQMIAQLGKEMHAAWDGPLPQHIARIPEKPVLADLLSLPECGKQLHDPRALPMAYSKTNGTPVALNLHECFSMLVCGPRQSGKTSLLKNLAVTFAAKKAQVHAMGGINFTEWAQKQGYETYEIGSVEWQAFLNDLFGRVVKERKEQMQMTRKLGADAYNACVDSFEPIVILIDDLESCLEKSDQAAQLYANLRHCCAENVAGFGIYFYASLSHAAFNRTRMKEPVATMSRAKRGVLLQGRLNECDPFDTPIPFAQKNVAHPLGEGLFVTDMGVEHIVIPKYEGN